MPVPGNPYSYRVTKDERVMISWQGRPVVTLAGKKASRFISQIGGLDEEGRQMLMARMTGNFKHGNERPDRER